MYIFTCENTFEDMMCCIYHAWEKAVSCKIKLHKEVNTLDM